MERVNANISGSDGSETGASGARHVRSTTTAGRRLRILTLTTLFPSAARPRHGIFVATRLRHLLRTGRVEARVVAPVPWFPFRSDRFGEYGRIAQTPAEEQHSGLRVSHPRYPMVPRIGMSLQPAGLAWAATRAAESIRGEGFDFDLIDAHYCYPDGVAAAAVAARLKRPIVITARGSDINVIGQMPGPGRAIRESVNRASAVIAVSEMLKQAMVDIGLPGDRISVIRNGVDTELFRPQPREEARAQLGLAAGPLIASVGNLVPGKGHELVLRALAAMPEVHVLIVGRGPEAQRLRDVATALGVSRRVRFLDEMPQAQLCAVYSAANVLVLASASEGWPNVLLESLACGTPVVATDVGGVREVLTSPPLGRVITTRDEVALAEAVSQQLREPTDPRAVRAHAEGFSWNAVSQAQLDLFDAVLAGGARSAGVPAQPPLAAGELG